MADVEESSARVRAVGPTAVGPSGVPPMVVQMMAVGEDTGSLDTMLTKISEFTESEVEATTEALTSLIEPILIAVVGGMIGAMPDRAHADLQRCSTW